MSLCSFYLAVRKQAREHLVDGTGHRPHYSLRTLCRALTYVGSNPCNSVQRSLYEVGGHKHSVCSLCCPGNPSFGLNVFHVLLHLSVSVGCADGFWCLQGFCMSFLTQLDRSSHPLVQKLVCQHILMGNTKCLKRVRSLSNSWQVLVNIQGTPIKNEFLNPTGSGQLKCVKSDCFSDPLLQHVYALIRVKLDNTGPCAPHWLIITHKHSRKLALVNGVLVCRLKSTWDHPICTIS